jgi:hypothetical protein
MTLANQSTVALYANLNWIRWWSKIDASNCWPTCGKVIGEAEDQVKQEIPKYYNLTFPIADLQGQTLAVKGVVDAYGITLMMRT